MTAEAESRTSDRLAAVYLCPPHDGFWRWSETGDAAEWPDGELIAFHEEIELTLRALAPHGLPPFGAVLLFLAACRDSWGTGAQRCAYLWQYRNSLDWNRLQALPPKWEEPLLDGLYGIQKLPSDLRHPAETKPALAEQLFESAAAGGGDPAATAVLRALAEGIVTRCFARGAVDHQLARDAVSAHDLSRATGRFVAAVRALLAAFPNIDEKAIRNRLATGVEALPSPAEIDALERPLLEQLRDDPEPELRQLAAIAHQIASVAHLPKPPSTPDELPLGGFSDVSNRGDLDRLLVSELALDDLTLSVRIAMNEALYLRRESPPKAPARRRVILVDNGIRLWGLPRLFAGAVGLALALDAEEGAAVEAFAPGSSDSEEPQSVAMLSRDGLLDLLGRLGTATHPAGACAHLLGREAHDAAPDFVLVTHPRAIDDPDFVAAAEAFSSHRFHIATVDSAGRYQLLAAGPAGRREISGATLDLGKLLADGAGAAGKLRGDIDEALPLFYRQPGGLPMRIAYPVASSVYNSGRFGVRQGGGEFVAVPRDGRMLYWDGIGRGARLLSAREMRGALVWVGLAPSGAPAWAGRLHLQTQGDQPGATLEMHELEEFGGHRTRLLEADVNLKLGLPKHTSHRGDHVALFWENHIEVISLNDGKKLASEALLADAITSGEGPFIEFGGQGWKKFTYTPGGVQIDDLAEDTVRAIGVWTAEGSATPWGIGPEGVPRPIGGWKAPLTSGTLVGVSANGHRALVRRASHLEICALGADGKFTCCRAHGDALGLLEPDIAATSNAAPRLRHRFNAVGGKLDDGQIWLRTPRGSYTRLALDDGHLKLHRADRPGGLTFEAFQDSNAGGADFAALDLKIAHFADGTRVFLDRNGFLHLCPADSAISPEISIALVDRGPLPSWRSDADTPPDEHPHLGGNIQADRELASALHAIAIAASRPRP